MSDYFFTLTDLKATFWSIVLGAVMTPIITYVGKRVFGPRKVSIPLWLLVLLISYTLCTIIGSLIIYHNKTKKLDVIRNQTFAYQTVELDGKAYVGCTFERCRLAFHGRREFDLLSNNFEESVTVLVDDRAALTTQAIAQLRTIPQLKKKVDKMLDSLAVHEWQPGKTLYIGDNARDTLDHTRY